MGVEREGERQKERERERKVCIVHNIQHLVSS
jgi:hypothetical protein